MEKRLFDSRYGKVEYVKEDNVILLTWKEKCSGEDYRGTTLAALSGLQKYAGSNFVVDARTGFEDESDDVQWGFQVLLPAMSQTSCKTVVFIMDAVNDIEEEMDMWSLELKKYFTVVKADSYEKAITALTVH